MLTWETLEKMVQCAVEETEKRETAYKIKADIPETVPELGTVSGGWYGVQQRLDTLTMHETDEKTAFFAKCKIIANSGRDMTVPLSAIIGWGQSGTAQEAGINHEKETEFNSWEQHQIRTRVREMREANTIGAYIIGMEHKKRFYAVLLYFPKWLAGTDFRRDRTTENNLPCIKLKNTIATRDKLLRLYPHIDITEDWQTFREFACISYHVFRPCNAFEMFCLQGLGVSAQDAALHALRDNTPISIRADYYGTDCARGIEIKMITGKLVEVYQNTR